MMRNAVHPQLADIPWESALCFTGHRPEKLPEGAVLVGLTETLYYYIREAVRFGYRYFFTGLADGVDYIAAEYLFRLRESDPSICVIGVQPCRDYEQFFRYRGYSLNHLHQMQNHVDRLIILPGSARDNGIFLRRNRFMTDHCSCIIAVCDNGRSGSMYTLSYAKKCGLAYCRLFPFPSGGSIPAPQNWQVEQHGFLP